jgi:ADP-ribose pyrophosphatase YjhB (NUDIX family)
VHVADHTGFETYGHEVLAVVLQVRAGRLCLLLWQRTEEPYAGAWALPGGAVGRDETLEFSVRRHLASKVDVRELSHLEQLETVSDPGRHQGLRLLATAYLGLVPSDVDPALPPDTAWHPVRAVPPTAFDHGALAITGRDRLRAKLSYTNLGYALAPPRFTIAELRSIYAAALGHDVSPTNLRRVLLRRQVLEPTGETTRPDRAGGRPAACFRFRDGGYRVTDQFAVLRPPAHPE